MKNTFRLTFENGDCFATEFNGGKEEALEYYLGRYFERDEKKPMTKCIKVEMEIMGVWCEIIK